MVTASPAADISRQGLFARAVYALDARLRRRLGIFEYSDDPACVFRASLRPFPGPAHRFADGGAVAAGDPVAELHLWTEHVPRMEGAASPIAWARAMSGALDRSLHLLAQRFPEERFAAPVAIFADMSQASDAGEAEQLGRIMAHFGFDIVPIPPPTTLGGKLHRFGENILVSLLVLARNVKALRASTLRRVRLRAVMSRSALMQRYGDGGPRS